MAGKSFDAAIAPNTPFYAIGDIHGCDSILSTLLEKIQMDDEHSDTHIVFVGDYVDRGEESAAVLRRLYSMSQHPDNKVTCLAGNHEDMMLRFLENPREHGSRWLRVGGLQTLASLGITGVMESSAERALEDVRNELEEALEEPLLTWLKELPCSWQNGNVAVVHAGANPDVPIDEQTPRVMMWGHRSFFHRQRQDGVWVVHGHNIVKDATAENGRIAIDTGAFATGKLTAAHISSKGVRFIQA